MWENEHCFVPHHTFCRCMSGLSTEDQVEECICGLVHICGHFWDGVVTCALYAKSSMDLDFIEMVCLASSISKLGIFHPVSSLTTQSLRCLIVAPKIRTKVPCTSILPFWVTVFFFFFFETHLSKPLQLIPPNSEPSNHNQVTCLSSSPSPTPPSLF